MILEANNIHKKYSTGKDTSLNVINGVTLSIAEGEIIAIVGPSGAGKSTLVHILGLLDRPTTGHVVFNGQEVTSMRDEEISNIRNRHIGFVFQFHHLLPEFSAIENTLMPALIAGRTIKSESARAIQLLEEVGLGNRMHHKPSELSGGEQQRVAVARALMNSPKVVFADEPSGNLDSDNAEKLHSLLFNLRSKYQQSFVIVTHNTHLAASADKIITLVDGRIV